MINVALSRVSERMLIADPGLLRLRNALRSGLSCTLTGVVSVSWILSHHQSITLAALAVIVAMICPLFLRDARLSAWYRSLSTIYLSAVGSFVVAALLAPYPAIADIGFLSIFFAGVLCQACGPRALGSALTSIVTFYLGLYLHPVGLQIATAVGYSLLGAIIVAIVGRLIVPARPIATLHRAIGTVTLRAKRLVSLISSSRHAARLQAQLSSMNEAALALEEHLSLLAADDADMMRERLVELEIAAGQLRSDGAALRDPAAGLALQHAIQRLNDGVRQWTHSQQTAPAAALTQAVTARAYWAEFRSRLSWMHATRATIAAILAMIIGHSLSPERWCWAVISVFVVFLGTRSRADTIHRGLERLGGTLAGACVSAVLAMTLHSSTTAMLVAMALCVFGWAYFILSSYSRGVFFITVVVGLIYAELGFAIGPLVAIRIAEVVVGCLVSFIVATFFFPLAASHHIDNRMLSVLQALRDTVQASASAFEQAHRLPGNATEQYTPASRPTTPTPSPASMMRKLDRSWHDLRIALRPFQTQRVFVWNPGYQLISGSLLACLHWTRTLSLLADRADRTARRTGEDLAPSAQSVAVQIDMTHHADLINGQRFTSILTRLDGLIASYRDLQAGTTDAAALRERLAAFNTIALDPAVPPTLMQLDGAVVQLVERLSASADYRPGFWAAFGMK